jgi:hypothetical protein
MSSFFSPARIATAALGLTALLAVPADAQSTGACAELLTNANTHIVNNSRGEWTIQLRNRGCRLDAQLRGDARYTADFRGIAGFSPGGSFTLEEEAGGERRRVELADDGRGGVAVHYRVNRETQSFDVAASAWLADRLTLLYRRAGFAATERAAWTLRTGGLDALLREAELVQSSSARATYLIHALEQPRIGEAGVVRVLGALPSSSSARAQVLRAVADRHAMQGRVAAAFLDAVRGMSSSSRQRELLQHVLEGGRAPRPFAAQALRVAAAISSSSAKGEVLRSVAGDYVFDDALLDAYLAAAGSISSSSWQREALGAVLGRRELNDAQLARVFRATTRISSSSARGDVLVGAASARTLQGEARRAYVEAASGISSSSQRARALEALERGGR